MAKLILSLCLALLAVSFVLGQEVPPECKPGGFVCSASSECCAPLICNPWAGRCTKQKTTTAAPTTSGAAGGSSEENSGGLSN